MSAVGPLSLRVLLPLSPSVSVLPLSGWFGSFSRSLAFRSSPPSCVPLPIVLGSLPWIAQDSIRIIQSPHHLRGIGRGIDVGVVLTCQAPVRHRYHFRLSGVVNLQDCIQIVGVGHMKPATNYKCENLEQWSLALPDRLGPVVAIVVEHTPRVMGSRSAPSLWMIPGATLVVHCTRT